MANVTGGSSEKGRKNVTAASDAVGAEVSIETSDAEVGALHARIVAPIDES